MEHHRDHVDLVAIALGCGAGHQLAQFLLEGGFALQIGGVIGNLPGTALIGTAAKRLLSHGGRSQGEQGQTGE